MNIIILGASGRTGQLLAEAAAKKGHTVTTFSRLLDGPATHYLSLTKLRGDARNQSDLEDAFSGQDVVISTLGSTKQNDAPMEEATRALIAAARSQGIRRVIMMSSYMVTPNFRPKGFAKMLASRLRSLMGDKAAAEKLLMESGLDWTIVYATTLTNAMERGKVRIVSGDERVTGANRISRADVAKFIVSQIDDDTYVQHQVLITSK